MSYLLDTDIIIYLLNDTFSNIRSKIDIEVGLLINFGESVEVKRKILDKQ